jgi:hypothetical protein
MRACPERVFGGEWQNARGSSIAPWARASIVWINPVSLSQFSVFADLLNVLKATAVSWERGLRSPFGVAVRLL